MHLRNIALSDQVEIERLVRRAVYKFPKKGAAVVDWCGGAASRREAVIAIIQGGGSSSEQSIAELRAAYQRMCGAEVSQPIMLLFLARGVAPPIRAMIVHNEEELVAASRAT